MAQPPTYRDPIDTMSRNRSGAVRQVDMLQGESREVGKTYFYPNWFAMSDRQKVAILRRLAEDYGSDPQMRFFVSRLLQSSGVQPRDFAGQAACIHAYVQNTCYYTNEPGEQIQSPWRTLKERTGDCDDLALLIAAMAHSVALDWKFALAGKTNSNRMVRWIEGEKWPHGVDMVHIYVYLGWPPFAAQHWAAAEPTIRGIPLGYDVVDRGLPGHAQQSVDLGGGGSPIGQAMHGVFADTGEPVPTGASVPVPANAALASAPAGVATYFGKLWEAIDWKEAVNAVVQGVIVSVAVPFALHAFQKRKKR